MSRSTTFAVAPFDGKYLTSFLIVIVMFALSLTNYEIFANQEKCQNFYLESECQGQCSRRTVLTPFDWNLYVILFEFF